MLHFNIDNPTGNYKLELSNCNDYAVGERLMLLDRWEASVAKRLDLECVGQRGVVCQIRNELYQGKPLHGVSCIAEFNVPEYGCLEFDYISSKRPPPDAEPIGRDTWDEILISLQKTQCTDLSQIEAITKTSHYFFLNSLQMRSLTGIFLNTSVRCELIVRLFLRITDMHNEKIFRARFDDATEFANLQNRLGHTTFFPFMQPEQGVFELDLGVFDQRIAFHILLSISVAEARDNLRDYTMIMPDGSLENFTAGMPVVGTSLTEYPKPASSMQSTTARQRIAIMECVVNS